MTSIVGVLAAGLVVAVGLWLLVGRVRERRRTRAQTRIESLPVDVVAVHDAPRGWKCSRLVWSQRTGELQLSGIVVDTAYDAVQTATCRGSDDHTPPVAACRCGFYAFSDRDRAVELLLEPTYRDRSEIVSVLCEVDLLGTVIGYERGYRAERQRVLSVGLLPFCAVCASSGRIAQADVVGVAPPRRPAGTSLDLVLGGPVDPFVPLGPRDRDVAPVVSLCQPCASSTAERTWALSEVASQLRTEVAWLPDGTVAPSRVVVRHQGAVAYR